MTRIIKYCRGNIRIKFLLRLLYIIHAFIFQKNWLLSHQYGGAYTTHLLQVEPGQPESEAEFLSILKSNQDNGKVWARLIAFTSEHKGVDAARARAEQALQTVSYR